MFLQPAPGSRVPIQHNFYQQAAKVKQLANQGVPQARRASLDAIGVRVLSWGFQDFRTKSAGGTAGGVTWLPILQSTVDARTRRLGAFRKLKTKASKQKKLAKGRVNEKIGVDTGRLVNSLKAGGSADQIFDVTDTAVVVGSQVSYAKWFDAQRPIFGPNFIDTNRQRELEALAARVYDREVKRLEAAK